ncbi:rho GTPase-activating protein 39 isoform X1 [Lepisosteus oculatus]|uniref:Rho GTPase-activating protein 39 n=2 Tax=Lepisosteus oculatus TaxID=7918 RepID=W5M9A6_LEPOC|nr:PREDICTED: rho GTPase-activating protein 39-like isoform X1 [Lepisosteus oculatus]
MAETSSDWVEILEPRSRERMYVNLVTGECGWEPPPSVEVRQCDGRQWWELFDGNNNRFYYYNSATQQTVWHRPQSCDIVPLAQLQAMKRSSESERRGHGRPRGGGGGSEGRQTPLQGAYLVPPPQDGDSTGRETPAKGRADSLDNRKEPGRETPQRWQPAPGTKAAMLVKVNSMGRNQPTGPIDTPQNHHHNNTHPANSAARKPAGGFVYPADKTPVPGKMAVPVDSKQALHLKKTDNGSFCLVTPVNGSSSSVYQTPHRSQAGTPRPVSPQYAATPPIYDEPPLESPIYDEPPVEMEVEGAPLNNGPSPPHFSPTHSLQKQGQLQHPHQQTKLLQYPATHLGSKHKRSPSATEYSPAGRECIRHMVNVDSGSSSKPAGPPLSSTPHTGSSERPSGKQKEGSGEKKQSWRILEANVLKSIEARHSRQNSLASQEYPTAATVNYQDSGYSTGPSPSLRRKNRRRQMAGQGRPGSVGSSGELNALNEKLMAEMRAVVGRSSTLRGSKVSLDTEMSENSIPRARSPLDSLKKYSGRNGSREDVTASNRSLYRTGLDARGSAQGDTPLSPLALEGLGRQKRTYEKVDSLEKSVTSQISLSSPEPPRSPSQAGTLESKENFGNGKQGGSGSSGSSYQYPYATLCKPPADVNMVDWASKNLNMHTQGIFRRRVSIANMLSWNRGSIKKPMLITSDRTVKKEACEMFKLVQVYMGDRQARLERRHVALLIVTKCWSMQGLRDELYIQLVRQTTDNLCLRSLAAGWELMAISLAFFSPSPKFRRYLEGYIQRHLEPGYDKKVTQHITEQLEMKNKKNSKSRKKRKQNTEEEEGLPISTYAKYCYRKLQKVAVTGGKKGLRKPTLEEIDHAKNAVVTPSLFGSALEEIMERQQELFPERKLPWVQVQLSQHVLGLGGAQTEGIFRVPGDIDEVNALKLQVDQWKIPENLSDPNVPASLLKLWYRELEEPVIPQSFYRQCISNYEDPEAAIAVVQSLPELNRLVLCYLIHFLQVFAQPVNVSKTKMDVNNLAMVMAPNCLRCQSDDPRVIFENTRKEMSFLRVLIVHLDTSFVKGLV